MSVATARCSDSSTASRSHCSCSERTPVALPGRFCTDDSTARVSLRRLPRSALAVPSRPSVPSLVLPSMSLRSVDPCAPRPDLPLAPRPSDRTRRRRLLLRPSRRPRRPRTPPTPPRARPREMSASRAQRALRSRSPPEPAKK